MKKFRFLKYLSGLVFALLLLFIPREAEAVSNTNHLDQIRDYSIWVDINQDASVNLIYDVTWEVLNDTKEGPLTWVKVGLPNDHYTSYESLTDGCDMSIMHENGEVFARIDLDRTYYKGQVAHFSFSYTTDYMYLIGDDGFTTYTFTPGWFNEIDVDNLNVYWDVTNIDHYSPAGFVEGGYVHWQQPLLAGDKFTVDVTYPNEAYDFNITVSEEHEKEGKTTFGEVVGMIIAIPFILILCFLPIIGPIAVIYGIYKAGRGFSGTEKITRTKIEYHERCPNCGGKRKERRAREGRSAGRNRKTQRTP
mgnify:CR=1 FL=1